MGPVHKYIELIPANKRKRGIWIIFSAILQALLNLAGLTVLIPIIIFIFDPDKLISYPWFGNYRELLLISIVCFIILKNLLNIWLSNIQVQYINSLYKYYSQSLYKSYFLRGFLFIKGKHSDELAYNTNAVCYLFTHGVLFLTFSIIAESCLFIFIWCGIFWFSPTIAICIAVSFILFSVIYFYGIGKKIKTYGEKEDNAKRRIMTLVGDTFRGYPDLKLNNAYGWFKKRFDVNIAEIAHSRKKIIKALHIPQGIIECYVVVGMILFVFIGGNNSDTRIILGVLSVAVLRILPSLRTIITKVIHLKDNAFTIDIIKNINLPIEDIKKHIQPVNFQEQIKIDNITFGYPATGTYIFNNFSLNIKKGECIGIQGISGIGKTTLFNLLLGFYEPQGGKIQIDDILLNKETYPAWQKLIAYVPQDIFIMDASLAENIAFGAEDINNDQLLSVIEKSGMKHYVSALPEGVHTRIGQNGSRLSGGERQRVGIARALYKKAEILLFDEATSSLDIKTEKDITDTINRLSKEMNDLTIIIISHKQSTLRICDRVFIISK
jgi:ABC-type multidrug transport system fused ATPase/permease subunit